MYSKIQPQCQRINSALPSKSKTGSRRAQGRGNQFKLRSNSSNALNKTDKNLDDSGKFPLTDKRSRPISHHSEAELSRESQSMVKAVKLAINDKGGNYLSGYGGGLNNKGIHLLPSTNKVYRNIKRFEFSRRMNMMDRPIVIISFEGIIGNFHKEKIWCDKNFKLITRGGAANGLRLFCNYFQVVLFVHKNTKKNVGKIKEWLKIKGVFPDAIYGKKDISDSLEEDYAQIFNDFNIVDPKSISKNVIVINSLDIDSPNIDNNTELEKLLFNKYSGKVANGFPYTITYNKSSTEKTLNTAQKDLKAKSILDMPLTILFPNILCEEAEDISMISIFKVILSIAFLSLKDYAENFKYSDLKYLKETDVKLQRQFLGLDLTNVCHRSNSCDALLRGRKYEEETATTVLSDTESQRVSVHNFKLNESVNGSFEMNQTAKLASTNDEGSDHDSCSSHTKSLAKNVQATYKVKSTVSTKHKTLNEACLTKVNWLIGFEEASSKQLFNCLWLCTGKVSDSVKQKTKDSIFRATQKAKRDKKLAEMVCDKDTPEEAFYKVKSNQITGMVGSILMTSGTLSNPLQNMVARNIRHFENIRRQTLQPFTSKETESYKASEEVVQQQIKDQKVYLSQISKYKMINNHVLAFGVRDNNKEMFCKVDKEREELIADEDFDLLKWFFGTKKLN